MTFLNTQIQPISRIEKYQRLALAVQMTELTLIFAAGSETFFVRQAINGIYVMDQWADKKKPRVSERFWESKGTNQDGSFKDPSNNADVFFMIEH